MDINLKPCPRCGGEAEIRHACEAIVGVSETGGYQPYCTDCLIAPPYSFYTKQDAADWWNDRTEYDELIQNIEKDKTKVIKEDDEITDIYITVNGEEYHFEISKGE